MNGGVVEYKPLTEAVTYSGEKYYKSCTPEEFGRLRGERESLFFDVSKRYVASAHVKDWGEADPDDVMLEWECASLTKRERQQLDMGLSAYLASNPTKKATAPVIRTMLERVLA